MRKSGFASKIRNEFCLMQNMLERMLLLLNDEFWMRRLVIWEMAATNLLRNSCSIFHYHIVAQNLFWIFSKEFVGDDNNLIRSRQPNSIEGRRLNDSSDEYGLRRRRLKRLTDPGRDQI